jgi:hypothetical protein
MEITWDGVKPCRINKLLCLQSDHSHDFDQNQWLTVHQLHANAYPQIKTADASSPPARVFMPVIPRYLSASLTT